MPYQILPDFNYQSRGGAVCSLTNLPLLRKAGEDFVVRLFFIEGEGGVDVRPGAIQALAVETLGMVPKEDHLAVLGRLESAESRIAELTKELVRSDETLMAAVNDLMEYLMEQESA